MPRVDWVAEPVTLTFVLHREPQGDDGKRTGSTDIGVIPRSERAFNTMLSLPATRLPDSTPSREHELQVPAEK